MNRNELMTRVEAELRSVTWDNPAHRDALRHRLHRATQRPASSPGTGPVPMLRRHRLLAAVLALAVLVIAAGAAYRLREVFFLRGHIADEPATFEVPVDAEGNARLIFIDEDGVEHEILVRPEDVDADGTIRGMEWTNDGAPIGAEPKE